MLFKIYFFKKKNRNLDVDSILLFFENYQDKIKMKSNDSEFKIEYYDENLHNKANFVISKRSVIPNIFKINPEYLDINFRVEFDATTNFYNAEKIFNIVIKLTKNFDYYIYNDIFDNVMQPSFDLLMAAYQRYKVIAKKRVSINEYHFIDSIMLYDMFKYLDERKELERYYRKDEIICKEARFLIDEDTKEFLYAIEWEEGEGIIFPPHITTIVYVMGNKFYLLNFKKVYQAIKDCLKELPGFSKGGYILSKKHARRAKKLMSNILYFDEKRDLKLIEPEYLIEN